MSVHGGWSPLQTAAPAEQRPHVIKNVQRCTPVHKLHVAFKIPYVYDYIPKLCMMTQTWKSKQIQIQMHLVSDKERPYT
jgi:hypothetical protein